MLNSLIELAYESGFCYIDWRMIVMWAVVAVLLYLAVFRQYEPLLLVPIAFGALLANLPTEGVINKPAGYLVSPVAGNVRTVFAAEGGKAFAPRMIKHLPVRVSDIAKSEETAKADVEEFFKLVEDITSEEGRKDVFKNAKGIPDLIAIIEPVNYEPKKKLEKQLNGKKFIVKYKGKPLVVGASDHFVWAQASGDVTSVLARAGQKVENGEKLVDVYSSRTGGLYHYIQFGVLLEIFPPLIFLGVGALTDFGPLIANPKMLLLGGAAQFGVFATFMGALALGFTSPEAASILTTSAPRSAKKRAQAGTAIKVLSSTTRIPFSVSFIGDSPSFPCRCGCSRYSLSESASHTPKSWGAEATPRFMGVPSRLAFHSMR